MDPDKALEELRMLLASADEEGTTVNDERVLELINGLDNWLSQGGFLPKAWEVHDRSTLKRPQTCETIDTRNFYCPDCGGLVWATALPAPHHFPHCRLLKARDALIADIAKTKEAKP